MMTDHRKVFDTIPDQFDKWRPRYNRALFDHLTAKCALGPDKCCLEIGPGTGQATEFALSAGCDYTGIELGEHLAAFMREKFGSYQNFRLINEDFERYVFPPNHFDLVYSAATIQWIQEPIAYQKCYEMLKPGGYLAMFFQRGDYRTPNPALFEEIQKVYRDLFVTDAPYTQRFNYDNAIQYGFSLVEQSTFHKNRSYSATEYVDYIGTHSDHIMLKQACREPFLEGIKAAILRHGDKIVFDDTIVLYLYRK